MSKRKAKSPVKLSSPVNPTGRIDAYKLYPIQVAGFYLPILQLIHTNNGFREEVLMALRKYK